MLADAGGHEERSQHERFIFYSCMRFLDKRWMPFSFKVFIGSMVCVRLASNAWIALRPHAGITSLIHLCSRRTRASA